MAAIGINTLTALTNRYIVPEITDNVYTNSNALLYRLIRGNKRIVTGGTQIEIPLMYRKFNGAGGSFRGLDVLPTAMQDTIKNGYVDWKQKYASMAVDTLTLIKTDSPLSIANYVQLQGQQMQMEMADILGAGIFESGTEDDGKALDGLGAIISNSNTYAGINRTNETWWQAQIDSSTSALSFDKMRGMTTACQQGAYGPSIWLMDKVQYNKFYGLGTSTTGYGIRQERSPAGHDEILFQAGFTNLMYENVPVVREDRLGSSKVLALTEEFLDLYVSPRGDFILNPWQKPHNQEAYVSTLTWAGNLGCRNSRTQGAFTNLSV